MSETRRSIRKTLTTEYVTCYTCPASASATVQTCHASNNGGSADVPTYVDWTDASDSGAAASLIAGGGIAPHAGQSGLCGPLYLDAGDTIRARADTGGLVDLTLSIVEEAV